MLRGRGRPADRHRRHRSGTGRGVRAGKTHGREDRRTWRRLSELGTFAWSIACHQNGVIQPINAKGKTQDGWNPHVGILDELHAHLDRALFDVIKSAFGARKNPLLWIITTAGFNTNGVCYEQRLVATKMLEQTVPLDHLFAIIFTIDEADDPFDERVWIKANPMIGITPTWETMRGGGGCEGQPPRGKQLLHEEPGTSG